MFAHVRNLISKPRIAQAGVAVVPERTYIEIKHHPACDVCRERPSGSEFSTGRKPFVFILRT
jgi:hypothetical protein